MPGGPRLCAFDLDGTLIDSQHHIVSAMESAFRAEGLLPPTARNVREIVGLSLDRAIARLAPEVRGLQFERVGQAYRDAYFAAKEADGVDEPLMPGAWAAIDAVAAAGWVLAVVTGKGRRGLHEVLEAHGLLERFAVLKSADDGPGKPDPTLLLEAVHETGSRGDGRRYGLRYGHGTAGAGCRDRRHLGISRDFAAAGRESGGDHREL